MASTTVVKRKDAVQTERKGGARGSAQMSTTWCKPRREELDEAIAEADRSESISSAVVLAELSRITRPARS
jgi:hypothetical protein